MEKNHTTEYNDSGDDQLGDILGFVFHGVYILSFSFLCSLFRHQMPVSPPLPLRPPFHPFGICSYSPGDVIARLYLRPPFYPNWVPRAVHFQMRCKGSIKKRTHQKSEFASVQS